MNIASAAMGVLAIACVVAGTVAWARRLGRGDPEGSEDHEAGPS